MKSQDEIATKNDIQKLEVVLETTFDALDQKFESKIDALDQKFESKFDALDTKIEATKNQVFFRWVMAVIACLSVQTGLVAAVITLLR